MRWAWTGACAAKPGAAGLTPEAPVAPPRPVERPRRGWFRRRLRPQRPPTRLSDQRAEEESMLAEAGQDDASTPRRDPEEAALELLQNELGARRIDNG